MKPVLIFTVLVLLMFAVLVNSPSQVKADPNNFKALLSRLASQERETHDVSIDVHFTGKDSTTRGHLIELGDDFYCTQASGTIYVYCGLIDRIESITIFYGK